MEKRKNIRVPFELDSTVRYNGSEVRGKVLNLSLQGMYLDIDEEIPAGTDVSVELNLSGEGSARKITLESRILRSGTGGTAIKLMDLNLESCIFLKDLIINESDNAGRILEEFYEFMDKNRTVQQ